MRISRSAAYALRLMVDLARNDGDVSVVSLGAVARRTGMSRRYLEQLAGVLRKSGLVVGVSGKGGGYRLSRPPSQIEVGEIFRAASGPTFLVRCVERPQSCELASRCECRWLFERLSRSLAQILDGSTLEQLAGKFWPQAREQAGENRPGVRIKC